MRVLTSDVTDDRIILYDHVPGHPTQIIQSPATAMFAALDSLKARGSDVIWGAGTWNASVLGYSDTTYVSISG